MERLRFKRDDGTEFPEWEEKTLGELGVVKKCKSLMKKQTELKDGIPFYKIGTVGEKPDAFISKELYDELRNKYPFPEKGDILISTAGTIGKTYVYDGSNCYFCQDFSWLKGNEEIDNSFLLQYYDRTVWDKLEGTTIKHLTNTKLLSKPIMLPCLEEQRKIGEVLGNMDKLIEQTQKKLDGYREYKKGAVQKLFSKEWRFKDDNGTEFPEWEEKTFGEVCASITYGMNAAATKYDGEHKYIRITDIDEETRLYKPEDIVSPNGNLNEKYRVGKNDILLARTGSVGRSYLYKEEDGIMYHAGYLIKAHVKDEYDSMFIFQQTLTKRYKDWVKANSVRSVQPGLNSEQYSSYVLDIPCLEEQRKIGDFLSNLDRLIELTERELHDYKEMKRGMLQRIFCTEK